MNADYVRTATAKGLSRFRVVSVHILRNSLIPVITFLGADLGALMGGAIVTEGIFNVPGVGNRLYQAVMPRRRPHGRLDRHRPGADLLCSPTCSLTCCTPGWTRGSAMTLRTTPQARPRLRRAARSNTSSPTVTETPLQATDKVKEDNAPLSLWGEAWRNLRRQPLFLISAFLILVVVVVSLFPGPVLADRPDLEACQLANSDGGPAAGHPLGFTQQGCDIYARVIYGTPVLGDGGPVHHRRCRS